MDGVIGLVTNNIKGWGDKRHKNVVEVLYRIYILKKLVKVCKSSVCYL